MSFTVSGLTAYVKQNEKEIAIEAVTSAATAKLLMSNGAVQTGIKGSAKVITMSNAATFVDGANCSRTASDVTTFSDRDLTVKPLRNNADFCLKDLYNKALVATITQGQHAEDSSIYSTIAADRQNVIGYEIEKLLWKGDTAGSGNLVWFDGLLKILSTAHAGLTLVGSDIISKLQSAVGQADVTVREQPDFRVFMGTDTYNALKLAVFNGKYFVPGAEDEVPGTGAKIQVVPGLNGTTKIVLTRISNFQMGVDMAGEEEKAVMKYDEINDKAMMDFYFALGIQVIFPTHAYWATGVS